MMDGLVAYGSYPNSKQGDITLKSVQDTATQLDKAVYPKFLVERTRDSGERSFYESLYQTDWPLLSPDVKPKEKKKEQ